jgi:hypothetical protein
MYRLQLRELKTRQDQVKEKWQQARAEPPSKDEQDVRMQKIYGKTRCVVALLHCRFLTSFLPQRPDG